MLRLRNVLLLCGLLCLCVGKPLYGQSALSAMSRNPVPGFEFDYARHKFFDGYYQDAKADFHKILARRTQGNRSPWLDAICYHAMIGECHYQLGEYQEALKYYDETIKLYISFYDWTNYLEMNGGLRPVSRPITPWGVSKRNNPVGDFPRMHLKVLWNERIISYGNAYGIMEENAKLPINAPDIVVCTALAIRHRSEILGPLSSYDPLNHKLVESLASRPAIANHWSKAWVDAIYGVALAAAGRDEDALSVLTNARTMPGQIDHQLTPTVMCEMGRILLRANKAPEAGPLFYEASIVSTFYGDAIILEECFRYMAISQRLIDQNKPCPDLFDAMGYASKIQQPKRTRDTIRDVCANPYVLASLLEEVADDALAFADLARANDYLNRVDGLFKGTDLSAGRYGTRRDYLRARLCYLSGRPNDFATGNQLLDSSMQSARRTSLWIEQIRNLALLHTTGRVTTTGTISVRKALDLYEELLREPTAKDWIVQPIDSLAVQVALPLTPMGMGVYELWFSAANELSYKEQSFEISERIRRKRFYGQIPFGSRLHSLRTIFEAPDAALSKEEREDRRKLQIAFPGFAQLSVTSKNVQRTLKTAPVLPKDKEQASKLTSLYKELEEMTNRQEMFLRSIALSRAWVPTLFPRLLSLEEIQDRLPEDSSLLVFFAAQGNMYGYMIGHSSFDMWQISNSVDKMRKPIAEYLAAIGASVLREVPVKNLRDDVKRPPNEAKKLEWRERGNKLFYDLLSNKKNMGFRELIIVPDHIVWYVPFETLCVEDVDRKLRPLFAANEGKLMFRYAPMASLAVPVRHGHSVDVETLVVAGKLHSKDDAKKSMDEVEEMQKEINKLVLLSGDKVPAKDALFSKQLHRLVVFNDIPNGREGGLNWNPFGLSSKRGSRLWQWLELPLGGPSLVVLPGFNSHAATSIEKGGNGSELFLAALTLQANGAESILISRWNPGGKTSYDLVEEFLKHYQTGPAPAAWKQAVSNVAGQFVQMDAEPRLKPDPANPEPLRGEHPFFWGGFLLIDRGDLGELESELGEEETQEEPEEPETEPET